VFLCFAGFQTLGEAGSGVYFEVFDRAGHRVGGMEVGET
jgi:hypothetical protein